MKLLSSTLAQIMLLQSVICGFAICAPSAAEAIHAHAAIVEGIESAHHPEVAAGGAAQPRHQHGHSQGDDSGSAVQHHCDSLGEFVRSAGASAAAPVSVAVALAPARFLGAHAPVRVGRSAVRVPPRSPDLVLRNSSFLL